MKKAADDDDAVSNELLEDPLQQLFGISGTERRRSPPLRTPMRALASPPAALTPPPLAPESKPSVPSSSSKPGSPTSTLARPPTEKESPPPREPEWVLPSLEQGSSSSTRRGRIIRGISPLEAGAARAIPAPAVKATPNAASELLGDPCQPRLPDSALPDRPGEPRRYDSALPLHQWESSQQSQQPQLQSGRDSSGEQTDQGITPMQDGASVLDGADVDIRVLLEPLPPGWHTSGNFEWGLHPSLDVFEDDSKQPGDNSPELDYNPDALDSIGAWEKCTDPEPPHTTASECKVQPMTSGTDPEQPIKDEVDFSREGSPAPPGNTEACDNGVALPVLPPSPTAATETLADIAGAIPDHPMSPHSEASEVDNTGENPPSPTGPPPSLSAQQRARLHALLQQRDEWGQAPYNLDAYCTVPTKRNGKHIDKQCVKVIDNIASEKGLRGRGLRTAMTTVQDNVVEMPQRTIGPGLHSHAEGHRHLMKGKLPYLAEDNNLVMTVDDGDI